MNDSVLFRDDFEEVSRVSSANWRLPDPSPPEATFLGRTQFRLGTFRETLPQLQDDLPEVVDGVARLRLDTLNPILLDPPENPISINPGLIQPSFFGTDLIINQDFELDSGLAFEARVRIDAPTTDEETGETTIQRGLVASLFSFFDEGIENDAIPRDQNIDEIDFEFLSNDINNAEAGTSLPQVLTNVFNEEPLGAGNGETLLVEGLNFTEFNTFRIEWRPDSVQWLVNDTVILNRTDIVPDEAQTIRLNFWAPGEAFTQAFDSSLVPVTRQVGDTNESLLARNQTFFYEVDFVQVEQLSPLPVVLNVDTTEDQNDGSSENGLSLRDAILMVNANPEQDYIIQLTTGETYSLTLAGRGDNDSQTGDLDITSSGHITIQSTGTEQATIQANFETAESDRVFHLLPGANLTLENLRITGGATNENRGGGILNAGGTLTLNGSEVSGNSASGSFGSFGGGIFNNGLLTLENTLISNNSANMGGGIFVENSFFQPQGPSRAVLNNSTVRNNTAQEGGGLFNSISELVITNSTIHDNEANSGGGISNRGTLTVSNSTLSGNRAMSSGGGLFNAFPRSAQTVQIHNSTITNNTSDADSNGTGNGGGIFRGTGTVEVENTIIAGNFDSENNQGPGLIHEDISGEVIGDQFNLVGSLEGASGSIGSGSDIVNSAPRLTPLQDNDGPTLTHGLLGDSPALDGGDPDFESPPEYDQRGPDFARVIDGNQDGIAVIDIGAFERQSINLIDGDEQSNELIGTPQRDLINGLDGSDVLLGRANNDELNGGDGRDLLVGGTGDDLLDGGLGRDALFGGDGSDQFILRAGEGDDIIFDYQDGIDQFLLSSLTFGQIAISSAAFDQDTLISIQASGEILVRLLGVSTDSLDATDFLVL